MKTKEDLLAGYKLTISTLDQALKALEVKDNETVIAGEFPIKITQLSNGQWAINGDINLVYEDKEDAVSDGEMVQSALKELKSLVVEPEYVKTPFYASTLGTSICIHEAGTIMNTGISRDDLITAKDKTGLFGVVPSISDLTKLANKLFIEANGDAQETSEMAKIKAELEEIKRGSADELGSILAKPGQVAGALTLAPAGTILAAGGLVATAPVLGFAAPVTVPVGLVERYFRCRRCRI